MATSTRPLTDVDMRVIADLRAAGGTEEEIDAVAEALASFASTPERTAAVRNLARAMTFLIATEQETEEDVQAGRMPPDSFRLC
jgi:hypothetical protein